MQLNILSITLATLPTPPYPAANHVIKQTTPSADLQYFLCYIVCLFVLFSFFFLFCTMSFYVFLCSFDSISGPRVLLSLILNK